MTRSLLKADTIEVPVQINGKVRGKLTVAADIGKERIGSGREERREDQAAVGRQDDQEGDRGAGETGEFGGGIIVLSITQPRRRLRDG